MLTEMPLRVLIADDHETFRLGIRKIIEPEKDIEIIGEAGTGIQLVALADKLQPDLILTDIKMPEQDGLAAIAIIKERHPAVHLIALSMLDEEQVIMDMIHAGIDGYLIKNAGKEEILFAIRQARLNKPYYCRHTSRILSRALYDKKFNAVGSRAGYVDISEKEKQLIALICEGLSSKEIGKRMFLNFRTIQSNRQKLISKLGVKNVEGLIVFAVENGMNKGARSCDDYQQL